MSKTVVLFLTEENPRSVLAIFPGSDWVNPGLDIYCYSHIGQHSIAEVEYCKKLKRARRADYRALQRELEGQGYDLYVLNGKRLINQIITPVNGKRGAPMGRSNVGVPPPAGTKVFDEYIPMSEPAYDKGGAYWGMPNNVRVRYTKDLSYVEFYRPGS